MHPPTPRDRFDAVLERIIADLPPQLHELIAEIPVIVDDEPSPQMLDELDINPHTTNLCGLHWGIPLTARSVEHSGIIPDQVHLFRGPILRVASHRTRDLEQQIRITLLHEIGHHFGLNETDLHHLGYS